MPKDRKKTIKEIKSKYKTRGKRAAPKMSRGRRSFQVGKELREQAASYTEQVTEEAEKAGKRKGASSWGSLLGSLGVPFAALMMTNPATAIGYLGMAALAGGGALAGSAAGVKASKLIRGGRKDVEVEKFYTSEAEQASKDIKEIDKQTRKQAWISAGTSALIAGVGAAAKAGKFATKTPLMGPGGKQAMVIGADGMPLPAMKTGSMFSKFSDLGKKIKPGSLFISPGATGPNLKLSGNLGKSVSSAVGLTAGREALKLYGIGNEPTTTQPQNLFTQYPYDRRKDR